MLHPNKNLNFLNPKKEQLRRRQEVQDRIVQQNEFLRASLRGSRKLQALQDSPLPDRPTSGIENDAFAEDEDFDTIYGKIYIFIFMETRNQFYFLY